MLFFEFSILGGLAGLMAGIFSAILSNYLAWFLFELDPMLSPGILALGFFSGALLVGIAGYLNVRPLLQVPPVMLLNEPSH
jgi:putative ABC transport system permease protein